MKLFDVYPLLPVTPAKAFGCTVWDESGTPYLDLYGGHAVISIGHCHPRYVEKITEQLHKIGFYSNSVRNPLQEELALRLGEQSGYPGYTLFLVNSGAEANENAIKLASFATGRKKFIAFSKGFHGRTSAAVALTDNPSIVSPVNRTENAVILPFNDLGPVKTALEKEDIAGVLVEGIQGVGGIRLPDPDFLKGLEKLCRLYGTLLILDEIQSGYGRSGRFFAHSYNDVTPDLITVAKGMGNGFPIGGLLISPEIEPRYGMLGTTFGGNHLACAAALAVLEVMKQENLTENAAMVGDYLLSRLRAISGGFQARGRGLMIGIEFPSPVKEIRRKLLEKHHIFTGFSGTNTIRLLPPLTLSKTEADIFMNAFSETIQV